MIAPVAVTRVIVGAKAMATPNKRTTLIRNRNNPPSAITLTRNASQVGRIVDNLARGRTFENGTTTTSLPPNSPTDCTK
jgi:hypothetical protein